MKIYNRKGFAWGLLWTALSGWLLIHSVLAPEPEPEEQIKNIVVGIILLLVGLNGLSRAFSRKASREDYIEEKDERNQLMEEKAAAFGFEVSCYVLAAAYFVLSTLEQTVGEYAVLAVFVVQLIAYLWKGVRLKSEM